MKIYILKKSISCAKAATSGLQETEAPMTQCEVETRWLKTHANAPQEEPLLESPPNRANLISVVLNQPASQYFVVEEPLRVLMKRPKSLTFLLTILKANGRLGLPQSSIRFYTERAQCFYVFSFWEKER